MKLHIVPARRGLQWVQRGMRTFLRQPLALSGLFFLFMALVSLLGIVPVLGSALALLILPGATLGLMAATRQAHAGTFPMPTVLLSAFRVGRERLRSMLQLGALYVAAFLLVLGLSALLDGGQFARIYLVGGSLSAELLQDSGFQAATLLVMVLYMPLSMLFWHAPALVHWHGVSPVKSLFFSFMACARNFSAFTVFSLGWIGSFLLLGMAVALLASLFGSPESAAALMFPAAMMMAAMFFTSIDFSFTDCFDLPTGDTP